MSNSLFIVILAAVYAPFLWWANKTLPGERWQILASIPSHKNHNVSGHWHGSNITFYGFLLASGGLLGIVTFSLLLAGIGIDFDTIFPLAGGIMLLSTLSSKLVARIVEKKKNTLTVAGGATVGLYLMPLAIWTYNRFMGSGEGEIPILTVMAALSAGYIIGEGVGRLACISFGCCYGRPLEELSPLMQQVFSRLSCAYEGETKKIVYASGYGGRKILPIQAITSFIYVNTGLVGIYLFLEGYFSQSFALTALISMSWRIFSEKFRADYRGEGKLTVYQRLGIVNIIFCLFLIKLLPIPMSLSVDLHKGFSALWNPATLLFFQAVWITLFLYTGLSKITGSTLSFHVKQENI